MTTEEKGKSIKKSHKKTWDDEGRKEK